MIPNQHSALFALRSPETIRQRCHHILDYVEAGKSPHFTLHRNQLDAAAELIESVTRRDYPDLNIPYHSRWRHFEAGGLDRKQILDQMLAEASPAAQARSRIDLTLVSVLLDAGAGPHWQYQEAETDQTFVRSEGLGVASFRAFIRGVFSSDPSEPLRVDANALRHLEPKDLQDVFQVSNDNPLVGLEGRTHLLNRLGDILMATPDVFGRDGRPGALFDLLTLGKNSVSASQILHALLDQFSSVWLTDSKLDQIPLGDCWQHPAAGGEGDSQGWVPFHKLSQWLSYSLLEPFQWSGINVTDLNALTGLPEYRNGGLLLDTGVIQFRDPNAASALWHAPDELIVEWRALTVALLDELAGLVRERFGKTDEEWPLACILQGGSWSAGREIANRLRSRGTPPLNIESDGTVF